MSGEMNVNGIAAGVVASETMEAPQREEYGKLRLFTLEELDQLPEEEWLIESILERGNFTVLYGPPGHGKSFLALDWSLHLATRRERWHGKRVTHTSVVYVAGEGTKGVRKRARAWRKKFGVTVSDFFVVRSPVQIRDTKQRDELIREIRARVAKPGLVVLDTFARCFLGGEENSSKDVGEFIDAAGAIQRKFGAAVLLVHHAKRPRSKKDRPDERGSGALRGAADSMVSLWKTARNIVSIESEKMKDEEEFKPITLRLEVVELETKPDGTVITSCVLVPSTEVPVVEATLPTLHRRMMRALFQAPERTLSRQHWMVAVKADGGESFGDRTFDGARDDLVREKHVEVKKRGVFSLTLAGVAVAGELQTLAA